MWEMWWWNHLMKEEAARGRCEIVASGLGELFIDWWTTICNIGRPLGLTPRELLQSEQLWFYQETQPGSSWRCYERLCSPSEMINGDSVVLWLSLRYLRSISTPQPGKLPTFGNISYCIDWTAQFSAGESGVVWWVILSSLLLLPPEAGVGSSQVRN